MSDLAASGLAARELAARVTAALERSILPTAIARGAVSLRVVAVADDGVVTLEVAGSPGAVLPMLTGIEAQVRAAVPGVTAVRLAAPASRQAPAPVSAPTSGSAPAPTPAPTSGSASAQAPPSASGPSSAPTSGPASAAAPSALPDAGGALADAAQCILDAEVNPAIAAHRGHVTVAGADGGWIRIRLEGGCQGCSLAEVTIRQGIEPLLRERLPGVTGVADITDHEAGTDPFFSPAKR